MNNLQHCPVRPLHFQANNRNMRCLLPFGSAGLSPKLQQLLESNKLGKAGTYPTTTSSSSSHPASWFSNTPVQILAMKRKQQQEQEALFLSCFHPQPGAKYPNRSTELTRHLMLHRTNSLAEHQHHYHQQQQPPLQQQQQLIVDKMHVQAGCAYGDDLDYKDCLGEDELSDLDGEVEADCCGNSSSSSSTSSISDVDDLSASLLEAAAAVAAALDEGGWVGGWMDGWVGG